MGTAEDHRSNPMKIDVSKFKRNGGRFISINPVRTGYSAIADEWVPIKPGTEGVLALGMANLLLNKIKVSDAGIPNGVRKLIDEYDITKVAKITGVAGHRIHRVTQLLTESSPSLVLAGPSVQCHAHNRIGLYQ